MRERRLSFHRDQAVMTSPPILVVRSRTRSVWLILGLALACGARAVPARAWSNTFTTLAGQPPGSADGGGVVARFNLPTGVAVDSSGTTYIADTSNNTIRKITPAGVVSTLAGLAGSCGSSNGTGSAARFCFPYGVAVDLAGTIYVADS